LKSLDSGFRRNDLNELKMTFYDFINSQLSIINYQSLTVLICISVSMCAWRPSSYLIVVSI